MKVHLRLGDGGRDQGRGHRPGSEGSEVWHPIQVAWKKPDTRDGTQWRVCHRDPHLRDPWDGHWDSKF